VGVARNLLLSRSRHARAEPGTASVEVDAFTPAWRRIAEKTQPNERQSDGGGRAALRTLSQPRFYIPGAAVARRPPRIDAQWPATKRAQQSPRL